MLRLALLFGILIIILVATSCRNNGLVLKKIILDKEHSIDTLEFSEGKYLLGVTKEFTFGRFAYFYAISKRTDFENLVYQLDAGPLEGRISKQYISFVKNQDLINWGWFNVQAGKLIDSLPYEGKIIDSLKNVFSKEFFLKKANGYFYFYKKSKLVKVFNYGNFLPGFRDRNFDSLTYGLYRLKGNNLELVSNNGNDFSGQTEGVYFVPLPGFGVVKKFRK